MKGANPAETMTTRFKSEPDPSPAGRWLVCVDTGGTFTDCVARDPDGGLHRVKVLSSSALRGRVTKRLSETVWAVTEEWGAPSNFIAGFEFRKVAGGASSRVAAYDATARTLHLESPIRIEEGEAFEVFSPEEAPVLAARLVTGVARGPLPSMEMRLATTRGTNALLEEKGAATAFFVNEGFGDLLRLGTQRRPDLFALNVVAPEPLAQWVIEVKGRLDAEGREIEPLNLEALAGPCAAALEAGCEVAAVALLHSDLFPGHEHRVSDFLRGKGFRHVSTSADLAPFIRILPRAETAVVDAYLSPVMGHYLERISESLGAGGSSLFVMKSSGGLTPAARYRAKDSLLSGPAAGVIGVSAVARQCGCESAIALDMGGTSVDVSRWTGELDYRFQHRVGRARLMATALKIETVAAGGGSICRFDGEKLVVGPESAGSHPGPACYGAGGPLTLTDVNLLLGRLDPALFGIPLDPDAARAEADRMAAECELAIEAMLRGFLQIANERMAAAIGTISVREGYDPADSALVAFGGAGGQHACAVAERLGVQTILCPADAGLLSAAGLRAATVEQFAEEQVLAPLREVAEGLPRRIKRLEAAALGELESLGIAGGGVSRRLAQCRLAGQETSLDIELTEELLAAAFERRYAEIYGYRPAAREIEVVTLRVVAAAKALHSEKETFDRGDRFPAGSYLRDELPAGAIVAAPATVQDRFGTVSLDAGWEAVVGSAGTLRLTRAGPVSQSAEGPSAEVIDLELFTHRFESIVSEMGVLLQRTALSTNIKERLDFSCALLDPEGRLVVNAPHIPVHLGAIGVCVRSVAERMRLTRGDMIVTNHPAAGGSHLPDVTVISPVFDEDGGLLGYVANRGHHAEMGGVAAGSMSPEATRLDEEGVVISPMYLFRGGVEEYGAVRRCLSGGRHPSRAVEDNLADLAAQAAANLLGVRAFETLSRKRGASRVRFFMAAIQRQAAEAVRVLLREFPDGDYRAEERLDDGTRLCVALRVSGDTLEVDFHGTSESHPGNLNATPAIVNSVLVYVLRLWLQQPLPLNEGLLSPVTVRLPRCFLNPEFPADPAKCPAVAGGNVETSQRLVDTFLKALSLTASGQGTMNNLVFGNDRCSYYETIGGGGGAGNGFAGSSGLHTHMTNTALTDSEILERRFPVRLERYGIRRGSGGDGRWRGGDGVVRVMRFLEPVSLSLLTQHRVEAPFGLNGGEDGAVGRQQILRRDGRTEVLKGVAQCHLAPSDTLWMETPGGGGWGARGK